MMKNRNQGLLAPRVSRLAPLVMISLLLIMMTTACGKKGPVRPKLTSRPQAPAAVTLQQQGQLFVLGWNIPTLNEDGSRVEGLKGFRVQRLAYDAADACPTCREPQEPVASLDLDFPAPAQRIGQRIYWRDTTILPGNGYRYVIIPVSVGNLEGAATYVHLVAQEPPAGPTDLRAEAGDSQVRLSWSAPTLPPGSELLGYNLYRRVAQRPFPIVPVNAEPLKETRLTDRGLDNQRAYEYRVSALINRDGQRLESMPTAGVLIAPQAGR